MEIPVDHNVLKHFPGVKRLYHIPFSQIDNILRDAFASTEFKDAVRVSIRCCLVAGAPSAHRRSSTADRAQGCLPVTPRLSKSS